MRDPAVIRELLGAILLVIGLLLLIGVAIALSVTGDVTASVVVACGLGALGAGAALAWRQVPEEPPAP